jgi:acyl-CoA dehydrogenase
MAAPTGTSVRAFLEHGHLETGRRLADFVAREISSLPPVESDEEARTRARRILARLGAGGWLDPIGELDLRGMALTREILAWASPLADAVFALQALASVPILLSGDEKLRERWAGPALRGEAMGAFAMTEAEAGSDVGAIASTARRQAEEYVLDGRKTFISNAGIADFYTVFASTNPDRGREGLSCFVVPAAAPGFRFLRPQILSEPHPLGEIALEGCHIPASNRLGREGEGFALGMAVLDRLRATVAAAACGMGARALDEALDHVREREQFGRPLSRFQLVQEKLARMATELEAARLLTYRAAWLHDRGGSQGATLGGARGTDGWEGTGGREGDGTERPRVTLEASQAKAFATEAAQRIVDAAVQLLGGRGVMADHPVDRLYRAVRALRIYEGTTEIQHLVISRELLRRRERETENRPDPGKATPEGGA